MPRLTPDDVLALVVFLAGIVVVLFAPDADVRRWGGVIAAIGLLGVVLRFFFAERE